MEQTMTNQRELLFSRMENLKTKQREIFLLTVEKLAQAVYIRDTYTGEHSRRVTLFALLLGQQLHLSAEDLEVIRFATPLHDIGKIGIADGILRKPGPLTAQEFGDKKGDASIILASAVSRHACYGYNTPTRKRADN
jgi:HD-GYP domain-containing protein (c-di-GMP phosphodiesterase class II)